MRNLFFAILLFFAVGIAAQTNPSTIDLKLIKGQPFTLELIGQDIETVDPVGFSQIFTNPDKGTVDFVFEPDELGTYEAVYKYLENGNYFYTTFNIEVVESLVELNQDYDEINVGESIIIDVLSNDHTTAKDLNLVEIANVLNGSAQILDNLIEFVPETDFSGLAYINYVAQDDMGVSETGHVTIHVRDANVPESVILDDYFVQKGRSLDIVIPSEFDRSDFGTTSLGKLSSLHTGVLRYAAGQKVGEELVTYNIDGASKSLTVHILDKEENYGFVRDDIVSTSMNESVVFDVFSNDLEQGFDLISKSPELKLVSPGTGLLSYSPPLGFQGIKYFYYEVSDGSQTQIGSIEILVNDNLPQTRIYEFTTRENTPFLIEHIFEGEGVLGVDQAPQNGIVRYRTDGFFYCGGQIGPNNLIYDPNDNFVGQDEFEIEYCSNGGSCVTVEVIMTVESNEDDCNCIGRDCVWPGDTDGDGLVTVSDILPVGLYLGDQGTAREETGSQWNALFSQDWENAKVDANGDGSVNELDVETLEANYSKVHTLLSSEVLSIKDVPFYAIPRETSGSAGDLMLIDLFVGTSEYPLVNSNGLAFNFSVPPIFLEEGSLRFNFTPSNWFGYNNAVLSTVQYPSIGRVDAAITRTGGIEIAGQGQIGTVGIVLQVDHDEIKPEQDNIPISINIGGGQYQSSIGERFGLESFTTTIYLELESNDLTRELEILTFPNPADLSLTIHANNQDVIQSVSLFNTVGQSISTFPNIQSNHFELNTSQLPEGFYMARVETLLGVSVEKIQVVRQ